MKTFTSGWLLQKPDQNYFKKFIQLNGIKIDGIIYPKRIPSDIEGIPVFDFEEASDLVKPGDLVLDVSTNPDLQSDLEAFFEAKGARPVSIPDFLDRLISEDQQDVLRLPVAGMKTSDIRNLKSASVPSLFDAHFLDGESHDLAIKLDAIFRYSKWERLVEFDREDTPQNVLFGLLRDLHKRGLLKHLSVCDTPRVFLDAILKLRLDDATATFTVSVSDKAFEELGGRAEFYRRCLADCSVPFESAAAADDQSILLSGSVDPVVSASARNPLLSAICFMPRSIVDYVAVKNALGERQYRIMLRQPDTCAQNLLAAILTPALLGV